MSETLTKICGIPIDDLLAIARIINCNPNLLEEISSGYSWGYQKGYEDAVKAFNEKVLNAVKKEPIYFKNDDFNIHGFQFEISPIKPPKHDISTLYRHDRPITVPKAMVVSIKTEKTKEEKEK